MHDRSFLGLMVFLIYLGGMLVVFGLYFPLTKQCVSILLLLTIYHAVNPTVLASTAHATLFLTLWLLPALGFCLLPSLSFLPPHQLLNLCISPTNSLRMGI